MGSARWIVVLNRAALGLAVLLFAALGVWWWRDRTRHVDAPRWTPAAFAALTPATSAGRPRWLVAVQPECPHCRARLADLARRRLAEAAGADLGAIVVDTPSRPEALDLPTTLTAGVWWDSSGVWRSRWGRRAYGEALIFDAGGRLVRVLPASQPPDSAP